MKTKAFLFSIFCCFSIQFGFSQTVEVLTNHGKKDHPAASDFAFIEPKTDSSNYSFVSTYKVIGKKKQGNIADLFFLIADKAKKDGATCFKLNYFNRNDSLEETTLILDTYFWIDSIRSINFDNHEQNYIYIFGEERTKGYSSTSFKIDNEKKEIDPGTYYRYTRIPGKKTKINKGGITGMTFFYLLDGNKPDIFLTLTGFGVGGPMPADVTGAAVNTGRINTIQGDFGNLLRILLKQSN